MKRLGYAAISGQKMIQIRQRLDVLFLLYYSYRCNSFKNMQTASWRMGRERTIELCCLMQKGRKLYPTLNRRSSRFWILEKTKTRILHTAHALRYYLSHIPKRLYEKINKRTKPCALRFFESFQGSKYVEQFIYTTKGDTEKMTCTNLSLSSWEARLPFYKTQQSANARDITTNPLMLKFSATFSIFSSSS